MYGDLITFTQYAMQGSGNGAKIILTDYIPSTATINHPPVYPAQAVSSNLSYPIVLFEQGIPINMCSINVATKVAPNILTYELYRKSLDEFLTNFQHSGWNVTIKSKYRLYQQYVDTLNLCSGVCGYAQMTQTNNNVQKALMFDFIPPEGLVYPVDFDTYASSLGLLAPMVILDFPSIYEMYKNYIVKQGFVQYQDRVLYRSDLTVRAYRGEFVTVRNTQENPIGAANTVSSIVPISSTNGSVAVGPNLYGFGNLIFERIRNCKSSYEEVWKIINGDRSKEIDLTEYFDRMRNDFGINDTIARTMLCYLPGIVGRMTESIKTKIDPYMSPGSLYVLMPSTSSEGLDDNMELL